MPTILPRDATQRKSGDSSRRAGVLLASLVLLAGCVFDYGPLEGEWKGERYGARCILLSEEKLGDPLEAIQDTPFGGLDTREVVGISPEEAVAVLIPEHDCGEAGPHWQLFLSPGLEHARIREIEAMFEESLTPSTASERLKS